MALPLDAEGGTGSRPDACHLAIRSVMKDAREALLGVLENITLADLCERARRLRNDDTSLDYVI